MRSDIALKQCLELVQLLDPEQFNVGLVQHLLWAGEIRADRGGRLHLDPVYGGDADKEGVALQVV